MKVPEFDKHLKKDGGDVDRNDVEITIKMKTKVRKPLMIKTKVILVAVKNIYKYNIIIYILKIRIISYTLS